MRISNKTQLRVDMVNWSVYVTRFPKSHFFQEKFHFISENSDSSAFLPVHLLVRNIFLTWTQFILWWFSLRWNEWTVSRSSITHSLSFFPIMYSESFTGWFFPFEFTCHRTNRFQYHTIRKDADDKYTVLLHYIKVSKLLQMWIIICVLEHYSGQLSRRTVQNISTWLQNSLNNHLANTPSSSMLQIMRPSMPQHLAKQTYCVSPENISESI